MTRSYALITVIMLGVMGWDFKQRLALPELDNSELAFMQSTPAKLTIKTTQAEHIEQMLTSLKAESKSNTEEASQQPVALSPDEVLLDDVHIKLLAIYKKGSGQRAVMQMKEAESEPVTVTVSAGEPITSAISVTEVTETKVLLTAASATKELILFYYQPSTEEKTQ